MTVLVTGASGFIGSALSRYLKEAWPRQKIVGAARRASKGVVPIVACHFENRKAVEALVRRLKPDIIFHCIGTTRPGPPSKLYTSHIATTSNVLEACKRMSRQPKVILLGSAAEYGSIPKSRQPIRETETPRPVSPYGTSKYCQTVLAQSYMHQNVPIIIGRLFNILAPNMPEHFSIRRFADHIKKAQRGKVGALNVGSLSSTRDFLSLEDVCQALAALARKGHPGEIYNICSGVPVRMRDVLKEMMRAAGVRFSVHESKTYATTRTSVDYCLGSSLKLRRDTGWKLRKNLKNAKILPENRAA